MQHLPRNRADQKQKMTDYRNSDMITVIDEYVHNVRDRDILKRRFIDGQTYEEIAFSVDMSVRQIKNIIYKQGDKLFKHLPAP